jgi:DNA-binding CsgD family transcriptional regulator
MERRTPSGRRLTDRQAALLQLVAEGLENKEIAHQLGISEQAVKEHVSNLLRIFGASNRAALAEAAATLRLFGTSTIDAEWLGFLFHHAPVHIAVLSGPKHRFLAVNDAIELASGGSGLVGRNYQDAFPHRPDSLALLDRVYASGERLVTADLPRRFVRVPGGEPEDGFITAVLQPLPGADGETAGIAVFSLDTTETVRARMRVRELETNR